jgi:glucokinase
VTTPARIGTASDANTHVIAIDIGGTKMAVAVVRGDGHIVVQQRIATDAARGPEQALTRLTELVRAVRAEANVAIDGCGIGSAGPLDPRAGVILSPTNLPDWDRVPLVEIVRRALMAPVGTVVRAGGTQRLGVDVVLDNDANAACLGEHRFGAGRGVNDLLYMTVSTGIGGGAIVDGRLLSGANGNAVEIGHISVAHDGWPCACGSRGCVEAFASGLSVARRARANPSPRLRALADAADAAGHGDAQITAEHVVAAVREGDPQTVALWDETMRVLGAGLASAINAFNPKRVVIGGGFAHGAGELMIGPVRTLALARAMQPLAAVCEVVPAALGADIGVLGAAAIALAHLERE